MNKIFHVFLLAFMICVVTSNKARSMQAPTPTDLPVNSTINIRNQPNVIYTNNQPTIQVVGSAIGSAQTDLVKISLEINSRDSTAAKALAKNSADSDQAKQSFLNLQVPETNITTTSFTFGPEYNSTYDYNSRSTIKTFLGYLVTNSLQIELSDLDVASQIIDDLSNIVDAQINGVSFSVSPGKNDDLQNKLIDVAMKDAEKTANLALKSVNYKIMSVASIYYGNKGSFNPYPIRFDLASESAPTLYANSDDTTVDVTVTYIIGPM